MTATETVTETETEIPRVHEFPKMTVTATETVTANETLRHEEIASVTAAGDLLPPAPRIHATDDAEEITPVNVMWTVPPTTSSKPVVNTISMASTASCGRCKQVKTSSVP